MEKNNQKIPKVRKIDLVKEVSEVTEINQQDVRITIASFFDVIGSFLIQKRKIEIRGFGTFLAKKRKKKLARNPKHPEQTVILPERFVPIIKFSLELRKKVSEHLNKSVL